MNYRETVFGPTVESWNWSDNPKVFLDWQVTWQDVMTNHTFGVFTPTLFLHMYPIFEPTESTFIDFFFFFIPSEIPILISNLSWIWGKILLDRDSWRILNKNSLRTLEIISMHLCSQNIYQSQPCQNLLVYFQLLKIKSKHLIQEPWIQAQTNKKKQEAGERP